MKHLLRLSNWIDALNQLVGKIVLWLVLAAAAVSAYNAIIRKLYDIFPYEFFRSSNAFLEIQWYFFAAVFLLGAGFTLLHRGHVRIDVIVGRFSRRTQVGVEIFGLVFFLFPFVISVVVEVWPTLYNAYVIKEMSENASGLIRWPVYALIPAGFALLGIQGISELIKRIAFLTGHGEDPGIKKETRSVEALVDEFRSRKQGREADAGPGLERQ